MEEKFGTRLKHAWHVLTNNRDPTEFNQNLGNSYYYRPDRVRFTRGNERTISASLYNRIAMDVASIDIQHCKVDENGRFVETINSRLNDCLTLEANIDQTHRAFIQDIVMSMFDEGVVAIVPIRATDNPALTSAYDIGAMRTAKITQWYPQHVKLNIYDDRVGDKKDIILPKKSVGIVENPLFAIINEPNSTMKRLVRKLALLDSIDEVAGSGKLDLILQTPYPVRGDLKRQQAEKRLDDLWRQVKDSELGIGYIDATEKVIQLNRPLENNLLKQIEYLTNQLYSQTGLTQTILDGTADDKTMLNYHSRTIEPIVSAIADEMNRKFLSKTARTQGQKILFFRDPFKLVPVGDMAEIADKFTRNEIMTSNEIRQEIGMKPSDDPKADQLVNSNISQPNEPQQLSQSKPEVEENIEEGENQDE